MAKPQQLAAFRWLLLLPIPALWCLASYLGLLDFLENKLVDWRFRFRGELSAPIKVIYVDVDSESIADLGNQPWDRGYYAEVCEALISAGHVRAVGIDFIFSEKGQPELLDSGRFNQGNLQLARFLASNPPVVLAGGYAASEDRDINGRRIVRVPPRVRNPPAEPQLPEMSEFRVGPTIRTPPNTGLIDTIGGGTRWVPLFAKVDELTFYHMSVELARLYWGSSRDDLRLANDKLLFKRGDDVALREVPLFDGQDVEVNWFSRWSSPAQNPRASFVDALLHARHLKSPDGSAERKAALEFFSEFKDGVVLIGPVDPLLQDIAPTPLDSQPVPRVGIHGNLLKTIVSGKFIHRLPWSWQIVAVFALTALVSVLAVGFSRSGLWARSGAGALLLLYVTLGFWLFRQAHWVLPLVAPVGAAFTTSFAAVLWQLFYEEKQKGRIKSMFGTYVSPALVNRMVESGEDPKLGGAEVEITAYFSDIQNFSTFSEKLEPTQLVELMNEYLTVCTDIVTAEGGTLDKYIGDAVVAMFGAPVQMTDHAHRACIAAVRVQQRLDELRAKWTAEGDRWPSTVGRMRTRIGLNSGHAVVGNMGSLTRFNYTMMGDSVNLAARLESGAKQYGAGTLVTEGTRRACELKGTQCVFRFIDRIVVKGRAQPVSIYELLGTSADLPSAVKDCVAAFEEGMQHYFRQEWGAAAAKFERAAPHEPAARHFPGELTPSTVYLQRCELLRVHPPGPDWDGIWRMETK